MDRKIDDVSFTIMQGKQAATQLDMYYLMSNELKSVDPIHYGQVFEPTTSIFFLGLLQKIKEGFTFIDVGANIGYYSVFCAGLRPDSKVYAFEPHDKVFEVLSKNAELYPNIQPFQCGISDEEQDSTEMFCDNRNVGGHSYLDDQSGDGKGFQPEEGMYKIKTQVKKLTSFGIDFEDVEVIKIDVQGLEIVILQDILSVLKSGTIILIEFCEGITEFAEEHKLKLLYRSGIEMAFIR